MTPGGAGRPEGPQRQPPGPHRPRQRPAGPRDQPAGEAVPGDAAKMMKRPCAVREDCLGGLKVALAAGLARLSRGRASDAFEPEARRSPPRRRS
ncbi:MAG: hypothetical protein MZV64_34170 [Ignavibacteriales bacterium]|nr:hypothetical protein [Ignavibacteriales bacterium]